MLTGHLPTPSPLVEDFARSVRRAERRVVQLQQRCADDVASDHQVDFAESVGELVDQLNALRTAEVELRRQNEELELGRTLLEYAESRYREMFDSAPDAYLVTDAAGTIREMNAAAGTLFSVNPLEAAGKPLVMFVPPAKRRVFRTLVGGLAYGDGPIAWSFELAPRTGPPVPVSARIVRSQPEVGQSAGLLWILRDIGDQVAAERVLRDMNAELERRVAERTEQLEAALQRVSRANRGKVDFLAALSHEIRTPLHALMAYTELLDRGLHGPVTDAQRQDLRRMREGHEHMLALINRILDFARLESGQTALEMVPIPVASLVRAVLGMMHVKCLEAGVSCLEANGPEDAYVYADMDALRQVLINLVGNAIKFNVETGAVHVTWENDDERIAIHVQDTGPGIAPNDLDYIFEPFTRVKGTGSHAGTGLGLPISRALVQAMGGELRVQSTVGEGSIFSVIIPHAQKASPSASSV